MTSLPSDMGKIWEALQTASPSTPVITTASESNLWFFNPVATITIPSPDTIATTTATTTANNAELDLEDVLKTLTDKFASMNSDIESDEHRYDESDYSVIVDGIHDIYDAVRHIINIIENNNL